MRICLVAEYFEPGGPGGTPSKMPELVREMKRQHDDAEIDVIASRNYYRAEGPKLPALEEWEGARVTRLSVPPSNRPSTLQRVAAGVLFSCRALASACTRRRYDVILVGTNPPPAPLAGRCARALRGVPYVYLIHDLYPDTAVALGHLSQDGRPARIARRCQTKWLQSAAGVIVLGRCMAEHVASEYGVSEDAVDVVPMWADPDEIPMLPKSTPYREKNDLSGFLIFYSGNIGHYQDFETVLRAAKLLKDERPDITFVLVGDGAQRETLEQRVADEQLANVRMMPFVPAEDFPSALASADALLVSLAPGIEGLCVPGKFYTSLAAGRAILGISGPRSEIARVLTEAECGLHVRNGQAEEFADAATRLADDAALTEKLGHNARQVLCDKFTLETAATDFYDVLERAAAGSASPE